MDDEWRLEDHLGEGGYDDEYEYTIFERREPPNPIPPVFVEDESGESDPDVLHIDEDGPCIEQFFCTETVDIPQSVQEHVVYNVYDNGLMDITFHMVGNSKTVTETRPFVRNHTLDISIEVYIATMDIPKVRSKYVHAHGITNGIVQYSAILVDYASKNSCPKMDIYLYL